MCLRHLARRSGFDPFGDQRLEHGDVGGVGLVFGLVGLRDPGVVQRFFEVADLEVAHAELFVGQPGGEGVVLHGLGAVRGRVGQGRLVPENGLLELVAAQEALTDPAAELRPGGVEFQRLFCLYFFRAPVFK